MEWSLYKNGKFLEPLRFSNGKTQKDIVEEILDEIKEGNNLIFLRGICGTGKSAIALNIAKEMGKTSIVVPIKNLQAQYKEDYEKNMYISKNNKKLRISVITGRKNHKCKFLEENPEKIINEKKEDNLNLRDILEGRKIKNKTDLSASNSNLPCRIEIREENWKKIKEYLTKNKDVKIENFRDIQDVKRISVGGACPYWSPVISSEYELRGKSFIQSAKRKYKGMNNKEFIFYSRKPGCEFYEQFESFINSDVIIFNSLKYLLETYLERKPETEIEIIDECDEFLDKLSNQRSLNLDRFQNSLIRFIGDNEEIVDELLKIVKQIRKNPEIKKAAENEGIIPLNRTGIYDILKLFLNNPYFLDEADEESYLFDIKESARIFENLLNESYVIVNKKENGLFFNIVSINLEKKFKDLRDKNKIFLLMSGTLHSEEVLKNVFGIRDYKIIEAEVENQGKIKVIETGYEKDCRYSNLSNNKFSRREYLEIFDKCIEISKKPSLVHVQAFNDLPSRNEKKEFNLKNLISREDLGEEQENKEYGEIIKKFKEGKKNILFSTRVGRGIDFPGEKCNSIIFSKYPNPNIKDAFWKILSKVKPAYYWQFYKDKARRELWQKVYRGIRSKKDRVDVLSPDSRVIEAFKNS